MRSVRWIPDATAILPPRPRAHRFETTPLPPLPLTTRELRPTSTGREPPPTASRTGSTVPHSRRPSYPNLRLAEQTETYCWSENHDGPPSLPGSPTVLHRSEPDPAPSPSQCPPEEGSGRLHTIGKGRRTAHSRPQSQICRDEQEVPARDLAPGSPTTTHLPDPLTARKLPFDVEAGAFHEKGLCRPAGRCAAPGQLTPSAKA